MMYIFLFFVLVLYTIHVITIKAKHRAEIKNAVTSTIARQQQNAILIRNDLLHHNHDHIKMLTEQEYAKIEHLTAQIDIIQQTKTKDEKLYYVGSIHLLSPFINQKLNLIEKSNHLNNWTLIPIHIVLE